MKEAGLPEIENLAWMAIMAPATTPNDIVQAHEHRDQRCAGQLKSRKSCTPVHGAHRAPSD